MRAAIVLFVLGAAISEIACAPYGPSTGQAASISAFVAVPPAPSKSLLGTSSSQRRGRGGDDFGEGGGGCPARSRNSSRTCTDRHVGLLRAHMGLDASATGCPRYDAASSCSKRVASAATCARSSPSLRLHTTIAACDDRGGDTTACAGSYSLACRFLPRSPAVGTSPAFAAAAFCRGGGGGGDGSSSGSRGGGVGVDVRPAGGTEPTTRFVRDRLAIDHVEETMTKVWRALTAVGVPLFHLGRLGFGLSLLFYGMAFRTFAFHVIVFRIAGMKQVQRAFGQLSSKYWSARSSIKDAAHAAESVGERVLKGDELKAAREKMIKEKKRLLSDGFLSEEETRYFMKKYHNELVKIKEEQDRFKSARSSISSVRSSVSPNEARAGLGGVYNALISSFTASTIQAAGQITLSLHVGSLLKTHVLDLFGPIIDPIGYRLDLNTYYDKEEIPYMGKANAMDGPQNLALNILCYSVVFAVFRVHPSAALKASMVYYGARVVTDYVTFLVEPARRKLGKMTIVHTPWSAVIHAGLTVLGYCFHRDKLYTAGVTGFQPFVVGPGLVGLVEPLVRFAVMISKVLADIDFFRVRFVHDPVDVVLELAHRK